MRTASTVRKQVDIHRNDNVKVITGRDKGKEGRVLRVFPNDNKLLVEHVMMVKKHVRPNPQRNIKGALPSRTAGLRFRTCSWCAEPAGRCASVTKCAATARLGCARSVAQRWISSCQLSAISL